MFVTCFVTVTFTSMISTISFAVGTVRLVFFGIVGTVSTVGGMTGFFERTVDRFNFGIVCVNVSEELVLLV